MDPQILREKTPDLAYQCFLKFTPAPLQFQIAFELLSWLQDDLLSLPERANAIYILFEHTRSTEHEFLSSIAEITEVSPYPWEKILFEECFKQQNIGKLPTAEVLLLTGKTRETENVKRAKTVRPVINAGIWDKVEGLMGRYDPEFLRPVPEFLNILSTESSWMTPLTVPEVLWDEEAEVGKENHSEIKELFNKALNLTLSPEKTQNLIEKLRNPFCTFYRNMPLDDVMKLVQSNPNIATEIIVIFHNTSRFQDILHRLINMEFSSQMLEVVNTLYMKVEIPTEAIHFLINNCIQFCKNSQESEYIKKKLVRLLCVFINSILRNRPTTSEELLIMIENFCTDFTEYKEASQLYKTVRSYHNDCTN